MFLSFSVAANTEIKRPYIISGFDDVLRQAENTGLLKASLKIFEKDKTFSGMPEFYELQTRDQQEPKFVLVSAISHWFENRIENFLNDTHYPTRKLYLRNWLKEWSIEEFKVKKIEDIIQSKVAEDFIIIFDNSDASINLAKKLKSIHPQKIKAIYLREVVAKNSPSEAVLFHTSFDIALNEYNHSRLSIDDLIKVGSTLLKVSNVEHLFPSYAVCPSYEQLCEMTKAESLNICMNVKKHIQRLCKGRSI
jgi:phosphatidate phosphatase APP1